VLEGGEAVFGVGMHRPVLRKQQEIHVCVCACLIVRIMASRTCAEERDAKRMQS
jgi:hypothetical protein